MDLWCGVRPRHLGTARVTAPHHNFHRQEFGRPIASASVARAIRGFCMPLLGLEPFIYPEGLLESAAASTGPTRWWALHTRPRAEKTLARRFLDHGVPFFLPVCTRQWRNRGRLFRSHLPLFPGYVFLHGDEATRLTALETNLVAHALAADDQQQLHADLHRVYQLITSGAPITSEERLEPGDLVEIVKGPFSGLEGKLIRRGTQLRLFVEVQFLRRAVSAEVETWMIRPLTAKAGAVA
jgi:transcriptional antiterminator RfaH